MTRDDDAPTRFFLDIIVADPNPMACAHAMVAAVGQYIVMVQEDDPGDDDARALPLLAEALDLSAKLEVTLRRLYSK